MVVKLTFSKPDDESLEAYERWILALAAVTGAATDDMTPAEGEAEWRSFWELSSTQPTQEN